ncbi:MAG: DUF362 domain-containing protein [Pseudomonadota bacterium]
MKSKVAVVKTKPGRVLDDIATAFDLAGAGSFLDLSAPVILKGNISWHNPFPAANSTPWQIEGTIKALQAMGSEKICAVENDTVVTDPYKGEKLLKFDKVFDSYGIEVHYNCDPDDLEWSVYRPRARMRILDRIFPEGIRIPSFFKGKNIVHLPTLKCHIYTTTTGAMKNAFGGLLNRKRHYTHSHIHETLVDLLAIQKEIHSGVFAVMDGTAAGDGPGPRTMKPIYGVDLMLASGDQVAIDAVAAKILGFDPMQIPYIALADEDGLGNGRPGNIEIVGEDVSDLCLRCRVGDNLASMVGDMLWFGPLKGMQKVFFHTPLVYPFVFGSFVYHDYMWYPAFGKRVWKEYLKTEWGRHFETY